MASSNPTGEASDSHMSVIAWFTKGTKSHTLGYDHRTSLSTVSVADKIVFEGI